MSRMFALLALLAAVGVVAWVFSTDNDDTVETVAARPNEVFAAPPVLSQTVQPLTDLDGWLQADFDELSDLNGQVVVVQFWTFGCINCKRTLQNLADMYDRYHDQGLEIVGVHAPEFEYEKDVDNIVAAAADLGVVWPIALDTEKVNFGLWQGSRRYWPRTYVIDRDGRLRFDHIGEGKYEELQATVAYLLSEEV